MKIKEEYHNGVLVKTFVMDEEDFSTQEEKDNWLSICKDCENNKDGQCSECGCIILSKIAYKDLHCPINKW